MSRRKRASPEQDIQRTCVQFLERFVPPPPDGPAWTAVNPVAGKSKAAASISKALGMRAGVHDLFFIWDGRFHGVEVKAKRGSLSPQQKQWHADVEAAGGTSCVIKDVADLALLLRQWGVPLKGRPVIADSRADQYAMFDGIP